MSSMLFCVLFSFLSCYFVFIIQYVKNLHHILVLGVYVVIDYPNLVYHSSVVLVHYQTNLLQRYRVAYLGINHVDT